MTSVLSWHKVSPHKRIILSKRLSTPSDHDQSSKLVSSRSLANFSEASGDFRRNKIFPADLPDCDPPRLKDVLSFTSSLADSDIGTSVSQDLSLSRQSDRIFTKSARSSRKISRSSLQTTESTAQREAESIFTIECLEVREGGEETEETEERRDYGEVRVRAAIPSPANSYKKYIIKKDHNHRKNRALLAAAGPQHPKATTGWYTAGSFSPGGRRLTETSFRCS